jgi:hypothetical protein
MKELVDLVARHTDSDGYTWWPDDAHARQQLALALYGLEVVSSLDYWISTILKLLDGTDTIDTPGKHHLLYQKYVPMKEGLARINPAHRDSIRAALLTLASGILFSSHVALDQGIPGHEVHIRAAPSLGATGYSFDLKAANDDLHDYVAEWIWNFSQYAEELVERREDTYGVSYRIK